MHWTHWDLILSVCACNLAVSFWGSKVCIQHFTAEVWLKASQLLCSFRLLQTGATSCLSWLWRPPPPTHAWFLPVDLRQLWDEDDYNVSHIISKKGLSQKTSLSSLIGMLDISKHLIFCTIVCILVLSQPFFTAGCTHTCNLSVNSVYSCKQMAPCSCLFTL